MLWKTPMPADATPMSADKNLAQDPRSNPSSQMHHRRRSALRRRGSALSKPCARITFLFALALSLTAHAASEDVPFITTPDNVTLAMLEAARVGPKDYVIDLGSGDGRIVIVAAKRFGASGLGVEIVPDLVKQSRENARAAGVEGRAQFLEQDLFKTELDKATVVTLYLLPEVNLELRPRILALKPGTRIVSHDWDMGDWIPDKTTTLAVPDKKIGLEKSSKVHLWIVPARVNGAWCGTGKARGMSLEIDQKFQQARGAILRGKLRHEFDARIEGAGLRSVDQALELAVDGERLRTRRGEREFSGLRGAAFVRRRGDACR
jgi:SAM-dependent methyltransferase